MVPTSRKPEPRAEKQWQGGSVAVSTAGLTPGARNGSYITWLRVSEEYMKVIAVSLRPAAEGPGGAAAVVTVQVRRSMHQGCLLNPRNPVFYPFFTHFPPSFAHFQRLGARNPGSTAKSPGENGKKSIKIGENGGN